MITRLQFCQSLAAVFIVSFAHTSTAHFLFGQHPQWSKTSTLTVLKIDDGLLHASVDVDAFATSTACCDLDL